MLSKFTRSDYSEQGDDSDPENSASISDRGIERELNEDRYAVVDSSSGTAWILCDGMGGVVGGDLAAQLAIDTIKRILDREQFYSPEDALRLAIEEANRVIVLRRQNPAFSKMGTTVIVAIEKDGEIVIAHAGDSRAYLIRGNYSRQLSKDHTYVQELVDAGKITAEEALDHPQAHVLTRCLGAHPQIKFGLSKYWCWPVESGETKDMLLLCSDGLYSLVDDNEIGDIVSENTPAEACALLTELANERGGIDNITIMIIPLPGKLGEEKPDVPVPRRRRKNVGSRRSGQPHVSLGRQVIINTVLFISGVVIAFIIALIRLITVI